MCVLRRKGMSNLIAALILLVIAIGVGVTVAFISSSMTQRLQPSGASLAIQSVRAQAVTQNKQKILVEVVAIVTGSQSIALTNAWLYWDSGGSVRTAAQSQMTPIGTSRYFQPGSTINVQIWFDLGGQPVPQDYAPIRVVIEYRDITGGIYKVSGSGTLEPYSP